MPTPPRRTFTTSSRGTRRPRIEPAFRVSRLAFLTSLLALALLATSCTDRRSSGGAEPENRARASVEEWFTDAAPAAGLDFVHFNGMTGRFYFPEAIPPGVALLDYDGDGDLDVFMAQGQMLGKHAISEALYPPRGPLSSRLYRNDLEVHADGTRTLHFTDVTEASGIV